MLEMPCLASRLQTREGRPRSQPLASKPRARPTAAMLHFHNMAGTRTASCSARACVPMLNDTTVANALKRFLHSHVQAPRFRTSLVIAGEILGNEYSWEKLQSSLDGKPALDIQYISHPCQLGFEAELTNSIYARSSDALQYLLEKYADPNTPLTRLDRDTNLRPLHLATCVGAKDIVQLLLTADANVNGGYPSKPLETACLHGEAQIGRLLLHARADPNVQHPNGQTPLHVAVALGNTKLVRLLLESAADTNRRGSYQRSALHTAARRGSPSLLRMLMSAKADAAAKDCRGHCPLEFLPTDTNFAQRFRCRQLLRTDRKRKTPKPQRPPEQQAAGTLRASTQSSFSSAEHSARDSQALQ